MDANVLIAALMRDSTTRRLLLLGGHELHVPEYVFEEIRRHEPDLVSRSGLAAEGFRDVLTILRAQVSEHTLAEYENELDSAISLLKDRDTKDAPYVALATAIRADGLWTEDRGLFSVEGLRVVRTANLAGAKPGFPKQQGSSG